MNRGIDVCTYQKTVDWAKVKASGVSFAMVKATQGRSEANSSLYLFTDGQFKRNIVEASNAGLRCGVYHYLTATTVADAEKEAKYFLNVIAPYQKYINLYAAVDVESVYLPQDKLLLSQIVNTFCKLVKAAGYEPVLYTNPDYLKTRLNDMSDWKLWLALWRNKNNVPTVKQYPKLVMWQWGAETVDGITSGKVDADFEIVEKVVEPDYAEEVCKKAGLQGETREYLENYKYSEALWKKLYEAMK